MGAFDGIALQFENYKSFGPGLVGFDDIAPINLIIGRNNSGKSALLDIVEFACNTKNEISPTLHHKEKQTRVVLLTKILEDHVAAVFRQNAGGGPFRGSHSIVGKTLIGAQIGARLNPGSHDLTYDSIVPGLDQALLSQGSNPTPYYEALAKRTTNPFFGKLFYRLVADRDIAVEQMQPTLQIGKNGQGFTSTISNILNRVQYPTQLVADNLLSAVNEIFSPDLSFSEIDVQQHSDNGPWEVFLNEVDKGRIALTHSGSGLKTVLLAAAYFLILPYIHKKPLSEFVFAFEELENNLHPALQRRLIKYVTERTTGAGAVLFLTTHSNVLIDQFSSNAQAQIVHVTQTGGVSQARRVKTYVDNRGVLDDLDVRASDLLQANGIVWVEGPSDRLYVNRWIELCSDGQLKEGSHYQCVYYGGRLLAHLSASTPGVDVEDVVQILRVNRNAVILIDSDKTQPADGLNSTKQRIMGEIERIGGMAWVTEGREVENYLPLVAIKAKFQNARVAPGQFEEFSDYLDNFQSNAGRRFSRNKVLFAEEMIPSISKESLGESLDLLARLAEIASFIRRWNGL